MGDGRSFAETRVLAVLSPEAGAWGVPVSWFRGAVSTARLVAWGTGALRGREQSLAGTGETARATPPALGPR